MDLGGTVQQHTLGTTLGGVNLYSSDPARLSRFYEEVLQAESIGGGIYYEISTPDATMGITDASLGSAETTDAERSAVELTIEVADADAEYTRLLHLDGWLSPPAWYPWARVARLRDPDGNLVSLQERAPGTASWAVRDWERTRATDQLYWHLREAWWWIRRTLDGLTDAEYFWEPVEGCWTIHHKDGQWTADFATPEPTPPPVTTIAWRLAHVRNDLAGFGRAAFPGTTPYETEVAANAADAVSAIRRAVGYLLDNLLAADDEDMRRPVHAVRTYSVWSTVCHALVEATHHTAEVGVLRDLHRRQAPTT